jgi:branched-chain amino acid aminotransferase
MASADELLGGGLYETVRLAPGGVRAGARHLARLCASARALGLPQPTEDAFVRAVRDAEGTGDAVRVTLHESSGDALLAGARREPGSGEPVSLVSLPGWYARGYRLREHKLTSHFHGVRGRALAVARGAGDALLVEQGSTLVGEATNANVFAIVDGVAVTPPIDGVLPGITRALCLELFPGLGLPVEESLLALDELAGAQGVLLTTSLRGLVPASSLDGAPLEALDPELLRTLAAALERAELAAVLALPLG